MKPSTKPLDQQGRIVVPRAMLESINVEPGDYVDVYLDNNQGRPVVVLERHQDLCVVCGEITTEGVKIANKRICTECASYIKLNRVDDGGQKEVKKSDDNLNVY